MDRANGGLGGLKNSDSVTVYACSMLIEYIINSTFYIYINKPTSKRLRSEFARWVVGVQEWSGICEFVRIPQSISEILMSILLINYDPKTRSMCGNPQPDADSNDKFYGVSTCYKFNSTYFLCFTLFFGLITVSFFFFFFMVYRVITNVERVDKLWSLSG